MIVIRHIILLDILTKTVNFKQCGLGLMIGAAIYKAVKIMRKRLVMLIKQIVHEYFAEEIADHIIADGWIRLPCKVGDTVWFDTWEKNGTINIGIQPHQVDKIDVVLVCGAKELVPTKFYDWEIGKTVFLSREEDEKALEGSAESCT